MRVVLVSSPGRGGVPHWSHAMASALAALLVERRVPATWLTVVRQGQQLDAAPAAVDRHLFEVPATASLARVAADSRHLPTEQELTRALRHHGASAVVHVGLGARGTPNVAWLADRLGASSFAVARAAEVVCHRGDLVDHQARACDDFLDAERCRRCLRTSSWSRASAIDLCNRADLLAASLLACASVFVPGEDDGRKLVEFGVPARSLVVAADAAAIVARVVC